MAKVAALKKKTEHLRVVPGSLSEWIAEAGRLQEEKKNAEKAYEAARKQVAMLMPDIPDDLFSVVEEGGEYEAISELKEKTIIDPFRVKDLNEDLFWRVVKIGVSDLQGLLSKEEFRQVSDITRSSSPVITIRKRKDDENKEGA